MIQTLVTFLKLIQPVLLQIASLGFVLAVFSALSNNDDGRALIYAVMLIATELCRIGDKLENNDEV